jgi:hypothetical protein
LKHIYNSLLCQDINQVTEVGKANYVGRRTYRSRMELKLLNEDGDARGELISKVDDLH